MISQEKHAACRASADHSGSEVVFSEITILQSFSSKKSDGRKIPSDPDAIVLAKTLGEYAVFLGDGSMLCGI